jgi:hypothetical protein
LLSIIALLLYIETLDSKYDYHQRVANWQNCQFARASAEARVVPEPCSKPEISPQRKTRLGNEAGWLTKSGVYTTNRARLLVKWQSYASYTPLLRDGI